MEEAGKKDATTYFRPNVRRMKGYVPGEQPKGRKLLKLNTNENPYPPSQKVIDAIKNYDFANLKRYPPPYSDDVRDAAEKVYGLPKECIIVGNGSDDILTIIFRSFAGEGEKVGWFDPSYSLYPELADIQGCVQHSIPLGPEFSFPSDAAEKAKGCKLFFIVRPNAPTGNAFPKSQVEEFVKNMINEGIVCIDEAYVDFCEDNCVDLVLKYPNVIVTRSLSKSYSLAGIRCGLGFANPVLAGGMHKVRDSYNLDSLAQAASAAALLDRESFNRNTEMIKATRAAVSQKLESLGFVVCPSSSNFIFCIPPIDASKFTEEVQKEGFLIRYFKLPGISQYVRISIGSDAEMEEFLTVTQTVLSRNKIGMNGH